MQYPLKPLICFALLALAGCGGGGSSDRSTAATPAAATSGTTLPAAHSQCSLPEARREVLEIMENFYFFNEFPEQVAKYADVRSRLDTFPSVDALLDELRYQPGSFDRGFSYYSTVEEVEQFFSAGEFYGFGFSLGIDSGGAWRLTDVFGGSPAAEAGLTRGATILSVDGTPTASLNPNAESTFGPSEVGLTRTLAVRLLDGTPDTVTLTKRTVDLDPVPPERVRVFEVGGRMVGYVFFRTFISNADALLRDAVVELQNQAIALGGIGIDDLVIDFRYNGGGLVSTAEVLGSLMAGSARQNNNTLFFSYEYNDWVTDNYGDASDFRYFQSEPAALDGLESVYYITDAGSASASELTISGMEPYMTRSVTVGGRTYGKPVGQWGLEYCNESMVLFVVTFRTVNADGEADYYTGIPANCSVADDWDHLLGDPEEGRLDAVLDDIEANGGLCLPAQPVLRAAAQSLSGAPVFGRPGEIDGPTLAAKLIRAF